MSLRTARMVCAFLICAAQLPVACRDYRAVPSGDGGDGGAGAAGEVGGDDSHEEPSGSAGLPAGGREGDALGGAAGMTLEQPGGDDGGGAGLGGQSSSLVVSSPNDFEGLVLWLEASTCAVDDDARAQLCPDGSGSGNDAGQLIAAQRPKLRTDGLNGLAVLTFDGGDATEATFNATTLVVADAISLRMGVGDFSLVVVGRWRNDAEPIDNGQSYVGYGCFFQKAETSFPYRGIALFANYPSGYTTVPAVRRLAGQLAMASATVFSYSNELNDDVYRVHSLRRSGGEELEVRINGVTEGSAQVSPNIEASAVYEPIIIGGSKGAALRGEIAEIVLIRGETGDDDLMRLEVGLREKYGI